MDDFSIPESPGSTRPRAKPPRPSARDFVALTRKPRPTRRYDLPARGTGNALVSVVTPTWGRVRVNGGLPVATPAWTVPVEAGEVSVELEGGRLESFTVGPGEHEVRVF